MAYYSDAPEIQEIANLAFPDYSGKKFRVDIFQSPMNLSSYWSGGSRNYFVIVNMANKRAEPIPENGGIFQMNAFRMSNLPENFAVVQRSFFSGKDAGITIYVNESNITKMLPSTEEVSWAEKVVLCATRSYKSSYAGIKDYRFREALQETGITREEWEKAKENLIQNGLLNKAGAITDKGRNAIGNTNLHTLKRQNT